MRVYGVGDAKKVEEVGAIILSHDEVKVESPVCLPLNHSRVSYSILITKLGRLIVIALM